MVNIDTLLGGIPQIAVLERVWGRRGGCWECGMGEKNQFVSGLLIRRPRWPFWKNKETSRNETDRGRKRSSGRSSNGTKTKIYLCPYWLDLSSTCLSYLFFTIFLILSSSLFSERHPDRSSLVSCVTRNDDISSLFYVAFIFFLFFSSLLSGLYLPIFDYIWSDMLSSKYVYTNPNKYFQSIQYLCFVRLNFSDGSVTDWKCCCV